MRGLLQLSQSPAVVRVSVFAVVFDELARGTLASLITSQFFDVPVISCVHFRFGCSSPSAAAFLPSARTHTHQSRRIRNFLLPQVMQHRESAEIVFGLDQWGGRDYVRLLLCAAL